MAKGWDRASLDMKVRPDKVHRDIDQDALMVPTIVSGGRVKLALLCLACGTMLSLLWVWTTLTLISILGARPGGWFYPIVGAAAVLFSLGLYVFSVWDFDRQDRWGREA